MTEQELRSKVVSTAESWLGFNELQGTHKPIIDLYNTQNPLPRGYKAKYTDSWCAIYVSAVAMAAGVTDIMPTECSCPQMISLYQKLGRWIEDDNYIPNPGDVIFYDWNDNGVGDDTGTADHVGIITAISGDVITAIEGNYSDSVKKRTFTAGVRYIRGYGAPDYKNKAAAMTDAVSGYTGTGTYTPESFLSAIKEDVLQDAKKTGILPSLTAAQALIESGAGNSKLSQSPYFNLFGIKWYNGSEYGYVEMMTTEYVNGTPVRVMAKFKRYNSASSSIYDHSNLFLKYDRYAAVRNATDYKTACRAVADAGYASSPTYADTLIQTVEKHHLDEWDQEYRGGATPQPAPIPATDYIVHNYALHDIRYGEKSEYTRFMQAMLIALGYSCGPDGADGEYGPNTEAALLKFQQDRDLVVCDSRTWDALITSVT